MCSLQDHIEREKRERERDADADAPIYEQTCAELKFRPDAN